MRKIYKFSLFFFVSFVNFVVNIKFLSAKS